MKESFKTLYSRATTGAIQEWTIVIEDDCYWTRSGQVGGKITVSKPTECKGKNAGKANATTDNEQALKDAQSKFDKKKKEGYFEDIEEVDTFQFVQPMLAHKYKDYADKIDFGVRRAVIQCKFNGGRCVATRFGLFTRKGEKILSCPHIEDALTSFFEINPDAVLDGELFREEYRQHLNKIMELIRRTKNLTSEHFAASEQMIRFYVYDAWGFGDVTKETPYAERKNGLDTFIGKDSEFAIPYTEHVLTELITSEDQMWQIYDRYVSQGHEGAIVRFEDSPYENKRSKNLLKLKPTDSDEFEIVDVQEGSGNWAGIAKRILCKMDDGKEFAASFKGNMTQAKEFLDNKDNYIGKKYEFLYNGFTGYGIPNFCQMDYSNSTEEKMK